MITEKDLQSQYCKDTGHLASNNFGQYYQWVKELYLQKVNEEQEFRDRLEEFQNEWKIDLIPKELLMEPPIVVKSNLSKEKLDELRREFEELGSNYPIILDDQCIYSKIDEDE